MLTGAYYKVLVKFRYVLYLTLLCEVEYIIGFRPTIREQGS